MADVLKKLPPKHVAAWQLRLSNDIAARAKKQGIGISLAASLMKRWLSPSAKGIFVVLPPSHLKTNSYVRDTLKYHRRVYLTEVKAQTGKHPNQKKVWAGIIPRLQDKRWNGRGWLDIYHQSLADVPVSVQAKAMLRIGNPGDLDLLYSLHGVRM